MTTITLKTLANGTVGVAEEVVGALRQSLRGKLCLPGEAGYDEARSLWNAMIDRRPGLVVRAAGAADVMCTVRFAADHGALLAVRGGGHNIAGNAVCEGGIMLDLSLMRSVHVDPATKHVRVEPGATLGDLDKETQAFGFVVPSGVNSTTGVAGLTLGGGFGWTTRKFGLTIDNLLSADLVTADGQLLHVNGNQNSNLFWALRGGGGNFGVVTSFEFRLNPLNPTVLSGLVIHPLEKAPELLRAYRRIEAAAPDELTIWVVLRKAPPLPFLPQEWHGREVMIFALCWCGDMEAGETAVAELRGLGQPIVDVVGPHPFTGWQAAFDPLLTPGARNYWKSHDFLELSDGAIDAMLAAAEKLPTPECEIFIAHVGGAMSRVPPEATAYHQRQSHFIMNAHTRWREAAEDAACIAWARALFKAAAPYATGSVYVNFMPEDEADRVAAAYGPNHARLAEIKRNYDPGNLFRLNQNIAPSAHEARAAS
jgi:FAD/FMN-containing dehydrogenase